MRSIILGLLFSAALSAQAVRVDPIPAYTVRGNTPIGAMGQVLAVPGTTISICVDPGCSSSATTYSGATAVTPCPSFAPITLAGGTTCVATTDNQGKFGFWLLPGTYFYKLQFPTGATFGPFPITAGGTSGGGGGTGTPGLPANSIQFNAAGAFAGSANLAWNNATRQETITSTPGVAGLNVAIGFVLSNQGFVADPAGSTTFNAIRAVSGGVAALSGTFTNYTNAGHYDTLTASGPPITTGDTTNPGALSWSTLGACLAVYNGTSWTCLGAGGAGNVVTASGVVVNGQCAQFNGVGNQVVSVACAGGGAGSGTVAAGTANQLAFYTATGTTVGGSAAFTFNGATHVLASSATGSIDLHLAPTTGLTVSATFPTGVLQVTGGTGILSTFGLSGLGSTVATTSGIFGPGSSGHAVALNATGDFVDSGIPVGGGTGVISLNGTSGAVTLAQTLGQVLVNTNVGTNTITLALPLTTVTNIFQANVGFLSTATNFNTVNIPFGGVLASRLTVAFPIVGGLDAIVLSSVAPQIDATLLNQAFNFNGSSTTNGNIVFNPGNVVGNSSVQINGRAFGNVRTRELIINESGTDLGAGITLTHLGIFDAGWQAGVGVPFDVVGSDNLHKFTLLDTGQALLGITANNGTGALLQVQGGISTAGHLVANGPPPSSVTCTGGTVTVSGNDMAGIVSVATTCTGAGSMVVNFSIPYVAAGPACVANVLGGGAIPLAVSTTTGAMTITNPASTGIAAGATISYICVGRA